MYSNRISSTARYNLLTSDIQKNEAMFNKVTAELASGKKVNSITDDPIAAVNIINTNRQLGQIETFNKNIGLGMSELKTMDDLLELAGGYLSQAWDKATQANNQTYGVNSLQSIKVEIDEITKTMVDLANTEFNDSYIFGGANTKILPYDLTDEGDIVYRGTPHDNKDYARRTEVADGVFETINTTGDKVFGYYRAAVEPGNGVYTDTDGKRVIAADDGEGGTIYQYENGNKYTGEISALTDGAEEEYDGIMGALRLLSISLQEVIDAKNAGDTEAEQAGYDKMFSTMDMFSNSHTLMLNEQTKFGGVYNRLEMTESTLETNNEDLTSYLSTIQDADLAESISKWYRTQYAYQASLQVAASSMGMSLLNYL